MLSRVMDNTFCYDLNNRDMLREVIVMIRLERIDTQKEVMMEVLLDSRVMRLVISLEFVRKQGFKLKNRKTNYQGHREKMEIDVIGGQKRSIILGMPQLAYHNPEINWKTGEVKITRYLEEYRKQQRLKQEKPG